MPTGANCSSGALVVYDGSIGPSSVLARACGRRFPWSMLSVSHQLYLRLEGITWDSMSSTIAFEYTSIGKRIMLCTTISAVKCRETSISVVIDLKKSRVVRELVMEIAIVF